MPPAMDIPETIPPDAQVFERLASQRWSCRAFLPEPVPQRTVEQILRVAQRTASWCNTQPWQVLITRGAATERFRAAMLAHVDGGGARSPDLARPTYRGIYLDRRREAGWKLYQAVGIARGDRAASALQARENLRFFGAPHVAIITSDNALGVSGLVDCGGFAQMFMLAATAHGVAAIAQAAIAGYAGLVKQHFSIGEDRQVVCAISFGYADSAHPANSFRTTRASIDEAASWLD
jgi:nitroreductase